jgi:uncharacterized protein (TIGR03382 family)
MNSKRLPLHLTFLTLAAIAPMAEAANVLVDPSLENAGTLTFDGPPFLGTWEGFNGGGATAAVTSTLIRTGGQSLELTINFTVNTFAGAFQDAAVEAGMEYSFSGYHATNSSPLELGTEARIEWRNASAEIGRTQNFTGAPGTGMFTPFALTAIAPVGATIARVVYAVQSFSTAPSGNGVVHVDDFSFGTTAVPEPGTAALGLLAGLGLMRRRR